MDAQHLTSPKPLPQRLQVEVTINLDGTGRCVTETPVGFLNHMLDQIASHGLFDLTVVATGDTWIDDHHTVEDIALALGSAFSQVRSPRPTRAPMECGGLVCCCPPASAPMA